MSSSGSRSGSGSGSRSRSKSRRSSGSRVHKKSQITLREKKSQLLQQASKRDDKQEAIDELREMVKHQSEMMAILLSRQNHANTHLEEIKTTTDNIDDTTNNTENKVIDGFNKQKEDAKEIKSLVNELKNDLGNVISNNGCNIKRPKTILKCIYALIAFLIRILFAVFKIIKHLNQIVHSGYSTFFSLVPYLGILLIFICNIVLFVLNIAIVCAAVAKIGILAGNPKLVEQSFKFTIQTTATAGKFLIKNFPKDLVQDSVQQVINAFDEELKVSDLSEEWEVAKSAALTSKRVIGNVYENMATASEFGSTIATGTTMATDAAVQTYNTVADVTTQTATVLSSAAEAGSAYMTGTLDQLGSMLPTFGFSGGFRITRKNLSKSGSRTGSSKTQRKRYPKSGGGSSSANKLKIKKRYLTATSESLKDINRSLQVVSKFAVNEFKNNKHIKYENEKEIFNIVKSHTKFYNEMMKGSIQILDSSVDICSLFSIVIAAQKMKKVSLNKLKSK